MKKKLALLFIVCILLINGCGRDLYHDGNVYKTKGLFTSSEKDPEIQYEVSVGNVIWGVILIETVIAPVYFWGFSCYNPVGPKQQRGVK